MTLQGFTYRLSQLAQHGGYATRSVAHFAYLHAVRRTERPLLTAVVVGRNDDYMPDFRQRLQVTVSWNTRHIVDEVIFVEWNPPHDRELLSIELAKQFKSVRAYVVPSAVHEALCENRQLPLLEYHAKNVGIRRARSPWVVATNADVALGLDTVRNIRNVEFSSAVGWTAQRVDIPWREGRQKPLGLVDCIQYRRIIPYQRLGTGDFLLASKRVWEQARGYDESLTRHRIGCDVRGAAQMICLGSDLRKAGSVFHLAHPSSCTEKVQPHHGEQAGLENLPYQNEANWGLGDFRETQIAERVWKLE